MVEMFERSTQKHFAIVSRLKYNELVIVFIVM